MFIYQPLTKKLYPTIAEAKKAIQLADRPTERDRDPRPLASTAMRLVTANSRLRGNVLTRRMAVRSFDWRITAADEADIQRAEAARRRVRRIINRVIDWHTDTVLYGVSAIELNWVTGGIDGTTPHILKRYRPVELERNGEDPLAIRLLDEEKTVGRTPIGAPTMRNWLADCDDSHEPGGLMRSLVYDQILLHENKLEWANFNRKLKGIIQAIYQDGTNDQDRQVALEALKMIASNNYSVTSDRITFDHKSMTDPKGSTSFHELMTSLATDSAIALLGQANTTELPAGGGSRAALQVLNLVRADIYFSDMQRIESLINDHLLASDFQLNGGPENATEAPWAFRFNVEEEDDAEKHARIITDYVAAGIPVVEEDAYDKPGLTRPTPESKLLEVRSPAAPPAL